MPFSKEFEMMHGGEVAKKKMPKLLWRKVGLNSHSRAQSTPNAQSTSLVDEEF